MRGKTRSEREAWLRRRDCRIGGSDAPTIKGVCPWETPFELWARKTGRLRPRPKNAAMMRGLELEPIARRAYEMKTGIKMPADEFSHPEYPFIGANFDGINLARRRVLEIKCPGDIDHAIAVGGAIPSYYIWQCVHLMMVANVPLCDYWSFDGWAGVLVSMKRDPRLEEELFEAEVQFWWHVTNDVPPPIHIPKFSRRKA